MPFVLKIKENIRKLQGLPLSKKKIILWTIVAIIGLTWIYFWFQNAKEKIKQIDTQGFVEQLNLPSMPDNPNIPEETPRNVE